jgi:hypothetical protein
MDKLTTAAAALSCCRNGTFQTMQLSEGGFEGEAALLFFEKPKLQQAAQSA